MPPSSAARRVREIATVLGFTLALLLPFLGAAFGVDEPYFLAMARQILRRPLDPLGFDFNWYGKSVPMSEINTHPLALPYLLALGLTLAGDGERTLRLLMLPFDLASALALYLIAARFLRRPLLPTLIILACPAYFIGMQRLMAEKWMGALGFWGLYLLIRSLDLRRASWFWASAGLIGAALLFKYTAVFLVPAAAAYAWARGRRPGRIAAFAAAALAPLALYLLWGVLFEPGRVKAVWSLTSRGMAGPWSSAPSRLRAVLAFIGGGGVAMMFWPWLDVGRNLRRTAAALAFAALPFLPVFDWDKVLPLDRWTGVFMAAGAALALLRLFGREERGLPGRKLWLPWTISMLFFQAFVYWSVVARYILFVIPPLVFHLAAGQEERWPQGRRRAIQFGTLAATLVLGLSLMFVDERHVDCQREMARRVRESYIAAGRKAWFTGHWTLQYYMEEAGAGGLDVAKGGWDQAKPGEVVIVPQANANAIKPGRPLLADVRTLRVEHPVPLRLLSFKDSQAGFYANIWGFLPYAISLEPVEEFSVVELR